MAKLVNRRTVPYQGVVYDLTVEKTHSYNVEGLAVHNSVGGSLVAWALGITQINPLQYGLIFERFLNEGRGSTPMLFTDSIASQIDSLPSD